MVEGEGTRRDEERGGRRRRLCYHFLRPLTSMNLRNIAGEAEGGKMRLDTAGEGCEGRWVKVLVSGGEGEVGREARLGRGQGWDL